MGRRISKELTNGSKTYYHYSVSGLIGEYDDDGSEIKSYGYAPGSMWGTSPIFQKNEGEHLYYFNDQRGAPCQMVDSNGRTVWQATYDAFGKATVLVNEVENNFRLPGQYFDQESGLHYNWHRYYEPETGRYLSVDPLRDGMNFYAYCNGDPLGKVDPWGLYDYNPCSYTGYVLHSDYPMTEADRIAARKAGAIIAASIPLIAIGIAGSGIIATAAMGEGVYLAVSGTLNGDVTIGGVLMSPFGGFGLPGAAVYSAGGQLIDNGEVGGEEFITDMILATVLSKSTFKKFFNSKGKIDLAKLKVAENFRNKIKMSKSPKMEFRRLRKEILGLENKLSDILAPLLPGLSEFADSLNDSNDTPIK